MLESPTWRASPAWAARLGYSAAELDQLNRAAIRLMDETRDRYEPSSGAPFVISGCVGPQGDGYAPTFHAGAADGGRLPATTPATGLRTQT